MTNTPLPDPHHARPVPVTRAPRVIAVVIHNRLTRATVVTRVPAHNWRDAALLTGATLWNVWPHNIRVTRL